MAEVFPLQPDLGSGGKQRWPRLLEEYDDGTYRLYKRGGAVGLGYRSMQFGELSLDELNQVLDFFDARMKPGGDTEFSVYDFKEVNSVDTSGMNTTGLHRAIFADDELEWLQDGPCTFTCTVRVKLLD